MAYFSIKELRQNRRHVFVFFFFFYLTGTWKSWCKSVSPLMSRVYSYQHVFFYLSPEQTSFQRIVLRARFTLQDLLFIRKRKKKKAINLKSAIDWTTAAHSDHLIDCFWICQSYPLLKNSFLSGPFKHKIYKGSRWPHRVNLGKRVFYAWQ